MQPTQACSCFVCCQRLCYSSALDVLGQALKRTLDTCTPSAILFTAAKTLPSAAPDAGNNADGKPAAAAQLPPPVPEVIDTEEAAPYAVTEATADAAPTSVSLADISRTMSSHELAASYTKINLAAEWTPGIAAAAESAFSIHPDHMRPVVGAQLGDSVVEDESLASAEEEVQNASSDEIIAAVAEAAASDKVRMRSALASASMSSLPCAYMLSPSPRQR